MEFIQKMKKREFIEMGLKTLAALLLAFIAIILMEGMIYGLQLNAYKTYATTANFDSDDTIAYCMKEKTHPTTGEDLYFVLCYNEGDEFEWTAAKSDLRTREQCLELYAKEVVFRAPNAFEFSITSATHYIVMGVFVAAVAGFFVYRFIRLAKEYKHIEENYKKNGTIEFN